MPTARGRLLALDAAYHHRRRRLLGVAVHDLRWSRARPSATCRARTTSTATAAAPSASPPTSRGFLPYRGVARTGVCFAMELVMDAIAREVGREPWEVRLENLVPASAMPYTNVANKHFDSGDYPASLTRAVDMIDVRQCARGSSRARPTAG